MEPYYLEATRKPHCLPCGHVFCLASVSYRAYSASSLTSTNLIRCLNNLSRRLCPLCRQTFDSWKARKLHFDLPKYDPIEDKARQLEERVAEVSMEENFDGDCQAVIDEVLAWLNTRPSSAVSLLVASSADEFLTLRSYFSTAHCEHPLPF